MLVDCAGKYQPQTLDQLTSLPSPNWLVSNLLAEESLAVLYGSAGVGKTFVALDVALSIATGHPLYGGTAVAQGPVVYVAGEGVYGIVRRARAWESHHARQAGNFFVVREAVPFLDSNEVAAFIESVDSKMPSLVIVDTLARCFGDGDENSTPDMNRFIGGLDRIRKNLACAVLVVHHSGHEQERERGSSALRGAADTMLRVTKRTHESQLLVRCTKQKDGDASFAQALQLHEVRLGANPDQTPVTSCVAIPVVGGGSVGPALSAVARKVLEGFPQVTTVTKADWANAVAVPERTFYSVAKILKTRGLVTQPTAGVYTLTDDGRRLLERSTTASEPGKEGAATAPPPEGEQCSTRLQGQGDPW